MSIKKAASLGYENIIEKLPILQVPMYLWDFKITYIDNMI